MTITIDIQDYIETLVLDIADKGFSSYTHLAAVHGGIPHGQGPWLDAACRMLQDDFELPYPVALGIMARVVRKDTGEAGFTWPDKATLAEKDNYLVAGYYAALGLAEVFRARRMVALVITDVEEAS